MKPDLVQEELPIYKNLEDLCNDERPSLDIMIMGYFTRKGYNNSIMALRSESPAIVDLIARAEKDAAAANVSTLYCGSTLEQIYGTWANSSGPTLGSLATLNSNASSDRPGALPPYCRELLRHGDLFLNGLRMIFARGGMPLIPVPPCPTKPEPPKTVADASCGTSPLHPGSFPDAAPAVPSSSSSVRPNEAAEKPVLLSPGRAPSVTSLTSQGERNRRKRNEPRHLNPQQQAKIQADFCFPNAVPPEKLPPPKEDSLDAELEAHMKALRQKDIDLIRLELAQDIAQKISQAKGDIVGAADSMLEGNTLTSIIETHLSSLINLDIGEAEVKPIEQFPSPASKAIPSPLVKKAQGSSISYVKVQRLNTDLSTTSLNDSYPPVIIAQDSPQPYVKSAIIEPAEEPNIPLIPIHSDLPMEEKEISTSNQAFASSSTQAGGTPNNSNSSALDLRNVSIPGEALTEQETSLEHNIRSPLTGLIESGKTAAIDEAPASPIKLPKSSVKEDPKHLESNVTEGPNRSETLNLSISSTGSAQDDTGDDLNLNLSTSQLSPLDLAGRNLKTPLDERQELTPSRTVRLQEDLLMSPTPEKRNSGEIRTLPSPVSDSNSAVRFPRSEEKEGDEKDGDERQGEKGTGYSESDDDRLFSPCPPTPTLHSSASKLSNSYFPLHENACGVRKCISFHPEDFGCSNHANLTNHEGESPTDPSGDISREPRIKTPSIPSFIEENSQPRTSSQYYTTASIEEVLSSSNDPVGEIAEMTDHSGPIFNCLKSALKLLNAMEVPPSEYYGLRLKDLRALLLSRLERSSAQAFSGLFDLQQIQSLLSDIDPLIPDEKKKIILDRFLRSTPSQTEKKSTNSKEKKRKVKKNSQEPPEKLSRKPEAATPEQTKSTKGKKRTSEEKSFGSQELELVLKKLHGANRKL